MSNIGNRIENAIDCMNSLGKIEIFKSEGTYKILASKEVKQLPELQSKIQIGLDHEEIIEISDGITKKPWYNKIQKIGDLMWQLYIESIFIDKFMVQNWTSQKAQVYLLDTYTSFYPGYCHYNNHKKADIFEFWFATGIPEKTMTEIQIFLEFQRATLPPYNEINKEMQQLKFVNDGGLIFNAVNFHTNYIQTGLILQLNENGRRKLALSP
jgi:hypothetical protein